MTENRSSVLGYQFSVVARRPISTVVFGRPGARQSMAAAQIAKL